MLTGFAQYHFSTLQEMLQYADSNSLQAKQLPLKNRMYSADEEIIRSGLQPSVNVYSTAEYYPVIQSMVIPDIILGGNGDKFQKVQFGLPINIGAGVELKIPVINFEKWEQLKASRLQSTLNRQTDKTAIENLHINITKLYYQYLLYAQLSQLNDENENVMKELLAVMEQRKTNNILDPADYNRSQNLAADIVNTGIEYRRMQKLVSTQIKLLLNIPSGDTLDINGNLKKEEWNLALQETEPVNRSAWQQAAAEVALAQQSFTVSKKAALPKFSFYSRYNYQWQIKPGKNSQQIGFDAATVGFRVDVPVFNGHFYKQQQTRNEAAVSLAQMKQQYVQASVQQEQNEWKINYKAANDKHTQLQKKLNYAADNVRIARLRFIEGIMEYDDVANIFREDIRARTEYFQNMADAIMYSLLLTINQ